MPRRRDFTIFSLSFLDVMSCGFGATILLYLILDHRQEQHVEQQSSALRGEVAFLEREVKDGTEDLAELRNTIARAVLPRSSRRSMSAATRWRRARTTPSHNAST
jgi:cell division protein FtsB